MISIIQGTIGSGKSYVSLHKAIRHLEAGGVIALNFDLVDGWQYKLADQNLYVRFGLWDREELADSYYRRCFKIGGTDTLYELAEKIPSLVKGWASKQREGQALLVIDEAHLYFNSRDWAKNKEFIKFFSQSRKLKYDILLVAHGIEMIDKQIRFFVELEERFRNTNKLKIPYTPIPLTPFTGFLIGRYYAGVGLGKGMRHSTDFYKFNKRIAELYDTFELFDHDTIKQELAYQGRKTPQIERVYKGNIRGEYSIWPQHA